MTKPDPEGFLDRAKLETLTMAVGRVTHLAGSLQIDAGRIIKDGCVLAPADKLRRKARLRRWQQLYPVRELVYTTTAALRHAAACLEAEWERTEESLCELNEKPARRL